MSLPHNSYPPVRMQRTPEMPPNPYHGGMPGQRSPWGHSSPRHYGSFQSPRHRHHSQGSPSNQWQSQHPGARPRFTPPHAPNYSPIPHQPSFTTPYSNNRSYDNQGRHNMGGGYSPHSDKRQGQKSFNKDRRYSGGNGGRGGFKNNWTAPIERYIKQDMLENPWAELEQEDKLAAAP